MENSIEMRGWLNELGHQKPLVIAGPCSAETEEQVLDIARQLKKSQVSIYRAGIWKPRTRPGGFEGVGAIGLEWLRKAKAETGLLMAVEVANANHVKLALENDIDVLWIGARTTVNPFAVQEIADALTGTDKIVLVKNPVNPDLALWLGGVERLYNAGIKNLGVVHRGFSTYQKTKYRNIPEWQLAIELHEKYPDLPILCDPSHITGRRDMIQQVSQQALDLNYDGLMIETHNNPDKAWSDAAQQVTPEKLKEILGNLVIRKKTDETPAFNSEIEKLRLEIDEYDTRLVKILGDRMRIADIIGELKKHNNVAILQTKRWKEVQEKIVCEGKQQKLSEEFLLQLFRAIHQESIEHQEKIINNP
ncbi:bifunctional 3-deoxy-7-phosphoheptulonate synthase/chorismate mutase type II [Flavobacterium sp. MK4S-17]|uniref:bifunctional 3-deoxy-7-phosphoheptulonate synthase/chorismate mutase type II n=1 Tax=Flavobacterium sp. MK4S-17 TaxID=2543737 RepID=UPI001358FCBF|nr:bifunctional 3-deoxy-7-phosphoheptulonate synthase/chorismate mutase type II [Flavobacterium sp. MK4S-17]